MRVALLSEGIYPNILGGIQVHTYQLAFYLSNLGYEVDVYTIWNKQSSALKRHCHEPNIRIIELEVANEFTFMGSYLVNIYRYSFIAKERIHQQGINCYQAIFCQGFMGLAFMGNKEMCKRLVLHMHGLNMFQGSRTLKALLINLYLSIPAHALMYRIKYHVSLGQFFTDIIRKKTSKKSEIFHIPNALSEDWDIPLSNASADDDLLRLIFIGRNDKVKGLEIIVKAVSELYSKGFNLRLKIIGPIETDERINEACIKYLGEVSSVEGIQELLKEADALVMASYSEGIPLVILEAMSCSCAIISTDVGAISEVVDESIGWLYDRPDVEFLKQKIILAYEDRIELRKRKRASWERFRSGYLWSQVGGSYLKMFDRVKRNAVERT